MTSPTRGSRGELLLQAPRRADVAGAGAGGEDEDALFHGACSVASGASAARTYRNVFLSEGGAWPDLADGILTEPGRSVSADHRRSDILHFR